MASSYRFKPAEYVVRVKSTDRRRRTIVSRAFTDYDVAMGFMSRMEAQYSQTYIVEFDTNFDNRGHS
jgi:hypothetical protein